MWGYTGTHYYRVLNDLTYMAKVVAVIVVLLALGAGVYYWMSSKQQPAPAPQQQTAAAPSTGQASAPSNAGLTPGTSDAELRSDVSTVDRQMAGFSSDSASVNSGLNDQPVQQSSI